VIRGHFIKLKFAFNDDKVSHYDCTCPSFKKITDTGLDGSNDAPTYKRPCGHIGAVLLVLKKKQEEETLQGKTSPDTLRKQLYVTANRRRTPEELAKEAKFRQKLQNYTVSRLRSVLVRNGQKKGGNKDELINRCTDGIIYGALPKCPLCKTGFLYYATGMYRCNGTFDRQAQRKTLCSYETDEVKRTKWKNS